MSKKLDKKVKIRHPTVPRRADKKQNLATSKQEMETVTKIGLDTREMPRQHRRHYSSLASKSASMWNKRIMRGKTKLESHRISTLLSPISQYLNLLEHVMACNLQAWN